MTLGLTLTRELPSLPGAVPAKSENTQTQTADGSPSIHSYSLHKYLFSVFYALAVVRSARMHEKMKIVGAVLTVLPTESRSRTEQTAVSYRGITEKAEEGQGAAGTRWSLPLPQVRGCAGLLGS